MKHIFKEDVFSGQKVRGLKVRALGIIALAAMMSIGLAGCDNGNGDNGSGGGGLGPDGGDDPLPLTGSVSISGTAKTGMTLTATPDGAAATNPQYQWKKGDANISGATSTTYTPVAADEGSTITVTVTRSGYTGSVTDTVDVTPYDIGDTGPAGGIIFYTNGTGDWKYLEAATTDITELKWASPDYATGYISGTFAAIGKGKENTDRILTVDAAAPAALACDEYSFGGFNDWFLPSYEELTEMFTHKEKIGGFAPSTNYLSSQENNSSSTMAYCKNFSTGAQGQFPKGAIGGMVRPVRRF
ncbi:hypothetical protein FACS1894140_6200 [Spirochaetia bacterium]|nr:hypothetical protein FACS1894140_6200 [Spirochaetia bacterium]